MGLLEMAVLDTVELIDEDDAQYIRNGWGRRHEFPRGCAGR
jgi:hypothetical protein